MNENPFISIKNEEVIPRKDIPFLSMSEFQNIVIKETQKGKRIVSFFGTAGSSNEVNLIICLADETNKQLSLLSTSASKSYPSLTLKCTEAHMFEREIAEQFSIVPEGHPCLKPIRCHYSNSSCDDVKKECINDNLPHDPSSYFQFNSNEVHEVALGPVHAGIIEPGHFRFQCYGEKILNLEIGLGYQYRGLEKALIGGPNNRTIHYMETAAGDTSIGHATAYCQAIESLSSCKVSSRANCLRAIALELERLANHTGDLGALANDVGFLPTAAYCGRLRGDFLNITALICGSRFGRELVCPGGVNFDCDDILINLISTKLKTTFESTMQAVKLLWSSSSVLNRFENTGTITHEFCRELGLVGVAARACGIKRDARCDFPSGIYKNFPFAMSNSPNGDVYSRAYVRYLEIQKSVSYIQKLLSNLPKGPLSNTFTEHLSPNSFTASLVEGWRGEICHIAMTDNEGKFAHYKIVDPSFHNWIGLAIAVKDEEISNFPLCNKSFNLSYCGHDL